MIARLAFLAAVVVVLLGPVLLRPEGHRATATDAEHVVVITPHNESIRYEIGRAFERHCEKTLRRRVIVDFRTPGGTSEITRYVDGEFVASFENYWRHTLKRPWTESIKAAFANRKLTLRANPSEDTPEEAARRAFLASQVGCRLDVFFGGGAYDFQQSADKGQLIDFGYIRDHQALYGSGTGQIPERLNGEPFWDAKGRWIGAVISAFGIVSNMDALQRLGIEERPKRWVDLSDPKYFGEIALANPTQSSSINKAFEMLIQQQMAEEVAKHGETPEALTIGWERAMRLLQRIGANARYFTDSSTKASLDVAAGDCAAGMTIDFFARFQVEALAAGGKTALQYVNAEGGTSIGVDPIGLFRGAPNRALGEEFVRFVLSREGQQFWNWRVGVDGGPRRYALRRFPTMPELYREEYRGLRTDPDVLPYEEAKKFTYHERWTGPLFRAQALVVRVMVIDAHAELASAWKALIRAGFPPRAMAEFQKVDAVSYSTVQGRFPAAMGASKIEEVRLARELADGFRAQYRRAEALARASQ